MLRKKKRKKNSQEERDIQRDIQTMRKECLENLTLKGHIKGQRETADKLLRNLCKWTSEQGLEKDVKGAKRC